MNEPKDREDHSHFRRRVICLCLAGLLMFGCTPRARAGLILDLPNLVLQPEQANQSFTIILKNDDSSVSLTGVRLELIIGNGDVAIGGSGSGPAFQAVTLLAPGTLLFAANNTGDRGAGNFAASFSPDGLTQMFQRLTSTSSGTVTVPAGTMVSPTEVALATVTFDTTGVAPGVYSWSAISQNGASLFTDTSSGGVVNPTLDPGMLTVVPEPVNVALSLFACFALGRLAIRRFLAQRCR